MDFKKMHEMMDGGNDDEKYEPLAPLSKKDSEEWDRIHQNRAKIRSLLSESDAKLALFWAKIEKKLKVYDRDLMIDNGMVLAKIEKKSNCDDHKGIPGFCNGDCENCAINHDDEDDK